MHGSNAFISTLFFCGILVFIAIIAENHPWRVDFTETGAFSLSDQTQKILKALKEPVVVKGFFASGAPEQQKAKDLLDTYKYYTDKISYEFIDPDRKPEATKLYGVRNYGTMVFESGEKKQQVQTADEENFTGAIIKLSRTEKKKIYFLGGHGEHSTADMERGGYSQAKSALVKLSYEVGDLDLLHSAEIPKDASTVVVAGPKKTLQPQELETLKKYVAGGGRLLVLLDPFDDGGLKEFLKGYGIEVGDDMVIDEQNRLSGGSPVIPVVMEYGRHDVTKNFAAATFYPEVRSMSPEKEAPKGIRVEALVSSSPISFAEKNLEILKTQGKVSREPNDISAGPVPLITIADIDMDGKEAASPAKPEEKKPAPKQTHVVASGDSDFASNLCFDQLGNGDLFLNIINYLSEEESLITIQSRESKNRPLLLTQGQGQAVLWVSLVIVPFCIIAAGLTVYRIRRRQR